MRGPRALICLKPGFRQESLDERPPDVGCARAGNSSCGCSQGELKGRLVGLPSREAQD